MGLFDKFLNPTWAAVDKSPNDLRQRLIFSIAATGGWRDVIKKQVLLSFVTEIKDKFPKALSEIAKPPIAVELTNHLSIAVLATISLDENNQTSENLKMIYYRNFMAGLFMSELTSTSRKRALLYSSDPEGTMTQFLIFASEVIGNNNSEFAQNLSGGPFAEAWGIAIEHAFSGMVDGMGRPAFEILENKAKDLCGSLNPASQAFIIDATKGRETLRSVEPTPKAEPLKSRMTNESIAEAHARFRANGVKLCAEVIERTENFLNEHHSEGSMVTGATEEERANPAAMKSAALVLRTHLKSSYLGLFMGLIGMRECKGNDLYITSIEFKEMEQVIIKEMAKCSGTCLKLLGTFNPENVQKQIADLMDSQIAIRGSVNQYIKNRTNNVSCPEQKLIDWYEKQSGIKLAKSPRENEIRRAISEALLL